MVIDCSDCPLIKTISGKVSGVPPLKSPRLPADTILENHRGASPVEEISENFDAPEQTVRELLS